MGVINEEQRGTTRLKMRGTTGKSVPTGAAGVLRAGRRGMFITPSPAPSRLLCPKCQGGLRITKIGTRAQSRSHCKDRAMAHFRAWPVAALVNSGIATPLRYTSAPLASLGGDTRGELAALGSRNDKIMVLRRGNGLR